MNRHVSLLSALALILAGFLLGTLGMQAAEPLVDLTKWTAPDIGSLNQSVARRTGHC